MEEPGAIQEFDCYIVLKKNGLILAPHLVNLLKDMGYYDFRTLSQLGSPEELEKCIRDTYSQPDDVNTLTDDEKKALFGPKSWKDPSQFKFLPGEKAAMVSLKDLSAGLQSKLPLVHPTPSLVNESVMLKSSKPLSTPSSTATLFSSTRSQRAKPGEEKLNGKGINVMKHIENWCQRNSDVTYGPGDYKLVNDCHVRCLVCKQTWKFSLSAEGYWKLSAFLQHVKRTHSSNKALGK